MQDSEPAFGRIAEPGEELFSGQKGEQPMQPNTFAKPSPAPILTPTPPVLVTTVPEPFSSNSISPASVISSFVFMHSFNFILHSFSCIHSFSFCIHVHHSFIFEITTPIGTASTAKPVTSSERSKPNAAVLPAGDGFMSKEAYEEAVRQVSGAQSGQPVPGWLAAEHSSSFKPAGALNHAVTECVHRAFTVSWSSDVISRLAHTAGSQAKQQLSKRHSQCWKCICDNTTGQSVC